MLLLIKFPFEIFYSKDHNIITFLTLTTLLRLLTFLLGFQILMLKAIILDLFVALELSLCFALAVSPLANFDHVFVSAFIGFPFALLHRTVFDYPYVVYRMVFMFFIRDVHGRMLWLLLLSFGNEFSLEPSR